MPTNRALAAHVALIALVTGSLAGCAARDRVTGTGPSKRTTAVSLADPTALIGFWTIAAAGTVIRLDVNNMQVYLSCGIRRGPWRADPTGPFLVHLYDTTTCRTSDPTIPRRLGNATSFRADGEDRILLDAQGAQVIRLTPGGRPPTGIAIAPSEREVPRLTDETRKKLGSAAPLPAGLVLAARDTLLGRWTPVVDPRNNSRWRSAPFLEFLPGANWQGSDGCNTLHGRWLAGDEASLLGTHGPATQVGCDNAEIVSWMWQARRAGFDADVLVLLDAAGNTLGRLRPDR